MNTQALTDTQTSRCPGLTLDNPELEGMLLHLHGCTDLPGLWAATRRLLDTVIPHDAAVFYVGFHDFVKSSDAARVFVTPRAERPAGWIQRRRAVDFTLPYILRHPGYPAMRLSEVVPNPVELEQTNLFRDYMRPDGWHYSACLLFWHSDALHSQLDIRRTQAQGDLTASEMALLTRLHPHIQTALNRLTRVSPEVSRMAESPLERSEKRQDSIRYCSNSMPRHVQGQRFDTNTSLGANAPGGGISANQTLRITMFSEKERAVLRLIGDGVSNAAISQQLGVTSHTVKWHLAKIYSKLGVQNRTAAVRVALIANLI